MEGLGVIVVCEIKHLLEKNALVIGTYRKYKYNSDDREVPIAPWDHEKFWKFLHYAWPGCQLQCCYGLKRSKDFTVGVD